MKPRTLSAIGGWQSFLFCIGMYAVALFFPFLFVHPFFMLSMLNLRVKQGLIKLLSLHLPNSRSLQSHTDGRLFAIIFYPTGHADSYAHGRLIIFMKTLFEALLFGYIFAATSFNYGAFSENVFRH